MAYGDSHARFGQTSWTLLLGLVRDDERDAYLDFLVRSYWAPAYAFLRRRLGLGREESEDLVQTFFVRLTERDFLEQADPARGKFRTLLLTCLQRFVRDVRQRKQGEFERAPVSMEELRKASGQVVEHPDEKNKTPEEAFWSSYAADTFERAFEHFQADCEARDKALWVKALRAHQDARGRPNYAELARSLGVEKEAFRNALEQGKRRYREVLREVVGITLAEGATRDEIDAEIRELSQWL
tara:strand:+ start:449 stop:1171 length:723 start_codon:yes stop_codon:yes gene_type:complete